MTVLAPLPDTALRFHDDFTTLDRSVWLPKVDKQPETRSGVQFRDDPANVTVANGCLELSVTPSGPGVWFGGEVCTAGRLEFTYGRVEVKAQLPTCPVAGLQATFWLWPVNQCTYGPWPLSGEVDFAEFYSQYPTLVIPAVHYWPNLPLPYRAVNPQAGFHRYQVDWRPGVITLAVDDQVLVTDRYKASNCKSPAPFDQPFFLVLTQTVGIGRNAPTAHTVMPATTRIDSVTIWH